MTGPTTPLYNLAPLLHLLLLGMLIALGPVCWVWWRGRGTTPVRKWQTLTLLTLFLTFDLVLFGAFTRLTDSGLGCPDWPGCYGSASPLGARQAIAAAEQAMPTGPVTLKKAWIEMIHRYLASAVGLLILVLTIAAWVQRRRGQPWAHSPWWPTVTFAWVCLQGAFGALTVTMKLFPAIVTLHLLGGVVLLMLLCVQVVRPVRAVVWPPRLRAWLWLAVALVMAQTLLGGWVSTNYAVLACTSFPLCQGSWWPEMAFADGFQIWRPLGQLQDGSMIGFAALTAIHYSHRLLAYVVLPLLGWLAWRVLRAADTTVHRPARWLALLTVLQLATGLSNVLLDWPLLSAVLHTGGANALMLVLTWMLALKPATPFVSSSTQGSCA